VDEAGAGEGAGDDDDEDGRVGCPKRDAAVGRPPDCSVVAAIVLGSVGCAVGSNLTFAAIG